MTSMLHRSARWAFGLGSILLLAACSGGSGGGGKADAGMLKLGITDAPVDVADAVVVQFSGVELKPKDGAPFTVAFTGGRSPSTSSSSRERNARCCSTARAS